MSDPILIVGAGPTGLTAALELSRFGVPVRLLDKAAAPAETSRAIGIQARTLELMSQRGLADEMLTLGNRARFVSVYGGGQRIAYLDYAGIDSRFNFTLILSQAETERILRDALARAGVAVERGVELVGLSQDALSRDPSPVHVVLRHADGRLEQARAPWLISAEGAHSIVRTTVDLRFEGKTFDENYVLGDLHVDGDLPTTGFHIFSSDRGFLALFPMGGSHFRLIASNPLSTPKDGAAPALDELQQIYDARSHIPARLHDMTWSSWFRINSRMVPRLKVGRLLLGGDAAHIHSPAGAQGMNTGIQDMINLGWKLALVSTGRAPEALLESYERDRLPVMRDVLSKTENLTGLIGSENALLRGLVNHLAPFVTGNGLVQANATARVSQIAVGYRDSPLSEHHGYGGDLHAGDRLPDFPVRLKGGSGWADASVFAALDPSRFALLVTQAATDSTRPSDVRVPPGAAELVDVAEIAAPAGETDAKRFHAAFGRRGSALLVRPDGYVAMTSGAHDAAARVTDYVIRHLSRSDAAAHA